MTKKRKSIIFLVGPTAVGKTDISIRLAKRLKAHIISCDSMQIYEGMDILSSKPSRKIRKEIPHYLIDIVSPKDEYSCAQFTSDAKAKIDYILSLSKVPLIVGGTGLYVKALTDGIFSGPGSDEGIRKRLYEEIDKNGLSILYKRLKKIDPDIAMKINPNDARRIVRALEVYKLTKTPISKLQKEAKGVLKGYKVIMIGLNRDREKLYNRINTRVDSMFDEGIVKEVKRLSKLNLSKSASGALGIKEISSFISGEHDLDEVRALLKQNTRNFAKRQLTWFRQNKKIKWFNIKSNESHIKVAKRIYDHINKLGV